MLELEAELALASSGEWPGLVESALADVDLPRAIDFLAFRWSIWREAKRDLLAGVQVGPDSLLNFLLTCSAMSPFALLRSHAGARQLPVLVRVGSTGHLIAVRERRCFAAGSPFLQFVEAADRSLQNAGVSARLAAMVASAVVEMAANAVEHAAAPSDSIVSFQHNARGWAFSVTDLGRGLRGSLASCPLYAGVSEREAMNLCLQHGVSRVAERGRGTGFTTLFQALAESMVHLSLRSGTVAGEWAGVSPTAQELTYHLLPSRVGFHLAVRFEQPTRRGG